MKKGLLKFKKGYKYAEYEGEFKNDTFHGQGKILDLE